MAVRYISSSDPKLVEFLRKRKKKAQEKREAEEKERAAKVCEKIPQQPDSETRDAAEAMDVSETGLHCSHDNVSLFSDSFY